ncbi:plakophilin-1 [Rana temporaria]|uniref:plakophilin-1 n=1 Tax=Rana temporaria TaxID=8407 RepID=UPI001AACC8F5|nr:plakophilin-1 [Rana temporaria]XP_040193667.1 plakophilin-1 [Rana temporaria]
MLSSPSPMKTALASEVFVWQNESSLALPSDMHVRSGTSRDQRVKEQVLMTVKRQKPRSSQSSTMNHGNRASAYETLEDSYNMNRNSSGAGNQYSKYQSGSSWGYQPPSQYNGTLKKETKRFSSQSQFDNWGRQQFMSVGAPTSPGSDYGYMQTLKSSRSEPDLTGPSIRPTQRRQTIYNAQYQNPQQQQQQQQRRSGRGGTNNSSFYSQQSSQWKTANMPARTPSSISTGQRQPLYSTMQRYESGCAQKQETYAPPQMPSRMDSRDEFDGTSMTIEKAVELLSYDKYQTSGANYIQHTCYQDENAKNVVYQHNGIPKLIALLDNPNQNVQQAAAGALRNLVFKNNPNKLETSQKGGVRAAVNLLRKTSNEETQKQLTGLLWNLSSTDQLKEELVREALPVLNECVVIPFSGWTENSVPGQKSNMHPEIFFNATGCLRNLSSAEVGRQTMRNTPGLVESLMYYIQKQVANNNPDDKSVENCACILHNLSYHLDSEVPNKYSQLNEQMLRNQQTDKTSTGCFSNKSEKIQNNNFDLPLPEEDVNPKGSALLSHSSAIKTYLSLLGQSKKDSILEASAGALQNLTASKGPMSNGMSQIIGVKENGLSQITRLLQSGNSDVVKTGASLLSNMSRHPSLHRSMGTQVLPDVSRLLSQTSTSATNSEDIMSSACYTMRNLVMSQPQLAKQNLSTNLVGNLVNMCKSGASPKAAEAARLFLTDMWSQRELQGILKQQGLDKSFMGSLASSALRNTVSRVF